MTGRDPLADVLARANGTKSTVVIPQYALDRMAQAARDHIAAEIVDDMIAGSWANTFAGGMEYAARIARRE